MNDNDVVIIDDLRAHDFSDSDDIIINELNSKKQSDSDLQNRKSHIMKMLSGIKDIELSDDEFISQGFESYDDDRDINQSVNLKKSTNVFIPPLDFSKLKINQ